ncbi:ArnT family glycosyltransferase [Yoonia algicola]|uniref:Glycosyltransferase RgtA/B/C/D-like domain-containing protein n=1 Tax=Yoonia algicola TaxID=3137368 RepID=A0AAN0M2K0_9RHOB
MTQLWNIVVRFPILIGIALIFVQTLPVLDARWLWFSDEVRYAEVYSNLVRDGHWVVLNLNGEAYPDKPPVYFLLLAALDLIPGVEMPGLMWLGSAVSAIFLLFAMRALASAVGIGRSGFAAGMLVQLSLFGMIFLLHYVRMDLLFVALMMAGQAYLHRFYYNGEGAKFAYLGFALAGLAVLVKGPLGLLLPLVAVWGAALWAGRGATILRLTTVLGLLLSVLVMASWAFGIIVVEGWAFFRDQIIGQQVVARATDTFHHSEPFYYYFIVLPVLLLPWTGFALALPWGRILQWPAAIWKGRRQLNAVGILAIGAFAHFVTLSLLDGKVGVYVLPILVQASLLIGALLASGFVPRAWVGVAAMMALFGAALIVFSFSQEAADYQLGALLCGALLVVLAGLLIWLRKAGEAALLVQSGAMVGWSLLLAAVLLPGLNESASTRITAEHLGRLAEDGYTPVAYRTYPGIFSYYAGRDVVQIDRKVALEALLDSDVPIVIAGRKRDLDALDLTGFDLLDSRVINGAGGRYEVVSRSARQTN